MQVLIKFTTPLQLMEGSGWPKGCGWRPVGTGVIFPPEVSSIHAERTLSLKMPTRLVFEDDVVVLQWQRPKKPIGVSVPTNIIAALTMQWR